MFSRVESKALFDAAIPSVQEKVNAILDERREALAELAIHPQASMSLDELRTLPALQQS